MAGFQNKDSKGGFQPPLLGGFQQPGLSDGHGGFQDDTKGLWLPNRISGLVDWHRSDMGITLVGSKVSAWADQSGQGHDLTQGTDANRLTYVDDVIGGRAVLRPTVSSQWLNWTAWNAGTATTAFLVVKFAPLADQNGITLGTPGTVDWFFLGINSQNKPNVYEGINKATQLSALVTGTSYLVKWGFDGTIAFTQVNATAEVSEAMTGTGAFSAVGGTPHGLASDIAEVIIYNRRLGASEEIQLRAYVTARYGIAM